MARSAIACGGAGRGGDCASCAGFLCLRTRLLLVDCADGERAGLGVGGGGVVRDCAGSLAGSVRACVPEATRWAAVPRVWV
jgi:hypothetical protein